MYTVKSFVAVAVLFPFATLLAFFVTRKFRTATRIWITIAAGIATLFIVGFFA